MRQIAYYPVEGGEDLVTPALAIKPGRLLFSKNYECDSQGKPRRIDGYERTDGRPAPSSASYWVLNFDAGSAAISAGNTVVGGTSSATATALYDAVVSSGAYGTSDAAGYLVLTNVSGTFLNDEALKVSGVTKSTANGVTQQRGASTDTLDTTWYRYAVSYARSNISYPAGSGRIRGVFVYNDKRYCFRNNAGGTACVLLVESAAGWVTVDLGKQLNFTSGGTTEIAENNVITGETSGATATVKRVVVTSGTWGAGDAAGYFVFTAQTGTFQAETVKVGAVLNLANIAGDSTAITLLPSGRYECVNHNFFGQSATERVYGCDGVNKGFEFDGTVFCPITTGMPTDTPIHVFPHKFHLFFVFTGGSIMHSGTGYPLKWSATSGALEIATGDDTTGIVPQPGGVLAIFGRNSTKVLYGNDASDWDLKTFSEDAGAIEWSIQEMAQVVYLDDRGVTCLAATQEFGDFKSKTLSQAIWPVLETKMGLVSASLRVRAKDQYRIFFTDNTGLNFTFNAGKLVGITRLDYGMPVRCCCTGEISGTEVLLFGSDNGYVYQLDKGTSFDGSQVEAMIRLPFNHLKYPEHWKRFFKAVVELQAPTNAEIKWIEDYNYGDLPGSQTNLTMLGGGGYWDISNWNEFLWSSPVVSTGEAYMSGTGKNLGIFIASTATHEEPHTIQGVIFHYSIRGMAR